MTQSDSTEREELPTNTPRREQILREYGERETCGAVMARVNGDPLRCDLARDHDGPHEATQRILAALENPESPGEVFDVVTELRAIVERKP